MKNCDVQFDPEHCKHKTSARDSVFICIHIPNASKVKELFIL